MAKKFFLNSEGTQQFSNALDLLNQSIYEFNQVADKMVPEKLLTEGLVSYLKDYCNLLQEESNIQFDLITDEEDITTSQEIIIDLFRSIRAIIFMLIRNSPSTRITLNVAKKPKLIQFSIQDDGTDIFRRPLLNVKQGVENVNNILASIGGTFHVAEFAVNRVEIEVPGNF